MSRITLSLPDLAPYFEERHERLAMDLEQRFSHEELSGDDRTVARRMGAELGLYEHVVAVETYDVRAMVLVREALGQVSPMADSIFAVQGLGSFPIGRAGSDAQKAKYLAPMRAGERIGAFALTEPEAGSDVASLKTLARRDGDGWVLDGEKTLISNATIADNFIVFANADPALGRKGITAFVVDRDTPGLTVTPIAMSVAHPIGRVRFENCRVPADALIGPVGFGFKIAMDTLDTFRVTVGAAANGMATRALQCAIAHVKKRRQFGVALAELQMVKAMLADMATELDASRLLVARAAHACGHVLPNAGAYAAMAKMHATEGAFRCIDKAVQLHGGMGVVEGSEVEKLLREVRPLRIYEGATEVQKLIIAKHLLA